MLTINCDGGSRGNPGPAASAIVVYQDGELVHSESKFLGVATNNVAEYTALNMALTYLLSIDPVPAKIIMDSELVTKQMNGLYKVKNENLKQHFEDARAKKSSYKEKVVFEWSARAGNKLADALVNEELDRQKK